MPAAVLDQLGSFRREVDTIAFLQRIEAPTLLLVGTIQANPEVKDHKLEYGKYLTRARVELVDGTQHLHVDSPEQVAKLTAELLAGN